MSRAFKIILVVFGGAVFGALVLSLLIFALLRLISPQAMTHPLGYQFLIFLITAPLGAVCGAILAIAIFGEGRSRHC